jgi:hypothetical protein
MHGVVIRDGTEPGGRGGLEFDLAEILSALGPRVAASRWSCRNLSYVSKDERDIDPLDRAASGGSVEGRDLLSALPQLLQVLDGEFLGTEGLPQPWVVIRAVDSGWWEVRSEDQSALESIRRRFRVVEDLPA